ncbi:MAG: hypothetical protein EBU08_03525 [Micrococcales bacterium]|nr:hypothetical protein [Micrococcales bacterium]
MAKYGNVVYGGAKYGVTPKLAYSVEPMAITVLDFIKIQVEWQSPTGDFTKIKLVRNQFGFPENSEDGLTIWKESATEGTVSRSYFVDGEDNPNQTPIVNGRQVYYTMFLFTDQKIWVNAGQITDLMPLDHGVHKKIMDIIPKVFTSEIQSPLGVTDETSALYNFIGGIAFTHEQFLSQLDVLRPQHSSEGIAFSTLEQNSFSVGLVPEPALPVKNQKRLIREALYMYSHKGMESGINAYAESLTGFAPTTTLSPNLLLSVQDSTFYESKGNWTATNAVLTSSTEQVPATGTNVIDNVYTGKLVAASSGAMQLGNTAPITRGVPVLPSTEYTVSCKLKSPSSAGNITLSVKFYDKNATITGTTQSATAVAANNTWKSASKTFTTPADASYASIQIAYSAAGTYYLDQVCLQLGNTVSYDEARAISIFLDSAKINYIKNPSFEVDASTWTSTGATFTQNAAVPTDGYSGTYSGQFVVATTGNIKTNYNIPVTAGKYYTLSFYVSSSNSVKVTGTIEFYDASNNLLKNFASEFNITSSFSRVNLTALTDSGSAVSYAKVKISFTRAGTYRLDLVQFEKSQTATEYFDGSLPSDYGAVWEGTNHASYTHMYPNKPLKIPRLGKTLNDWIVPNTFWRLSTYDGVEYTNLTV